MDNRFLDASRELRMRANNGHLSGSIPGMAAVQAAIALLEEAAAALQKQSLLDEIAAMPATETEGR